jgi:chemotaxis protein CheX
MRCINTFVGGVDSVFQTMLSVKPRRCPARVGKGNRDGPALTSLVGFSGQVHGVVVLRFPSETAVQLAGRMLGTEMTAVNEEVIDAISEIVNMVAGSAKAKFDYDPPLELGLPTVVQGSDYKIAYPSGAAWLEVPFESDAGEFRMELTFESN